MTSHLPLLRGSTVSRRDVLRSASAAGLAVVAYGMGRTAHGQSRPIRMVTLSHSDNSTVYAQHMVADQMGFFKEAGLKVEFIVPGGGARVAQIIAGDQAPFAQGDSSHPVLITARGRPCQMIYSTDTRCAYANILLRKELWDQGLNTIEKLATMKRPDGSPRVIAATAIGSGTWVYGSYVLSQYQANGKSVNDQVKWVGGGGSSTMLGGLKSGQFDAVMAVPLWIETAKRDGYGALLYDVRSEKDWVRVFKGIIPTTVGYVLKKTLDTEPELSQDYVTAMWRAQQWIKGRDPEQIYDAIGKKFMAAFAKDIVMSEIRYYQPMFNYEMTITHQDFENSKRVLIPLVTDKDYTYEALVDMRFIEKARKA
jgi:NitT/TauT family transport system substrate-binding protein